MNETDVRELVVRPLISRLGYRHGTDAYVETEIPLSYSAAFLGRKKPQKDPPLRGRADYICGVVASGRWVVEVKGGSEELSREVFQQAHTYAAHPEVAAFYFLITNGREFKLFETGRLHEPILSWTYDQQEAQFMRIQNVLGPDAIRNRSRITLVDAGEPLGKGLSSKLEIVNGSMTYVASEAPTLSKMIGSINGIELPVSRGSVVRDPDGRLHATVSLASVAPLMRTFGAVGVADEYEFFSSSRYLSTEEDAPNIFQNFVTTTLQQGTQASLAGAASIMPFDLQMIAFTEVVGFVEADTFQGVVRIESEMEIGQMNPMIKAIVHAQFGITPGKHRITQRGSFRARLGVMR